MSPVRDRPAEGTATAAVGRPVSNGMRLKPHIVLIIASGWGLFLLLQHYVLLSPIFNNLFSWLIRIFLLSLIFLVSEGLGEFILSKFRMTNLSLSERRILGAGLGLSSLSYIVFFAGVFKLYYFFTGFIIIGTLFLLLWPRIKRIFTPFHLSTRGIEGVMLAAIAVNLAIILLGVCIPPLDYDTLEYHLGVPAQYINAHGLIYLPYNVFSNFPLHVEMLYTLGLLLEGPILSKMIHFLFLILTLFIVFLFGNKISPRSGLLASLIFVNIPVVAITGAKAYNDLGLTFFGLASIYTIWRWHMEGDIKFLFLAGIFAGSALAAKYTALIFFAAPLAAFALGTSLKKERGIQCALSKVFFFIVITFFTASPWFVKNLIYTGDPVFPVAYKQLGGKNWGEYEAMRFKKQHQADLSNIKKLLEIPKKILSGEKEELGITILLSLPFLFFIKSPPPVIKCLGLYSGFYFLAWTFFTHQMPRFLIPCAAVLSILLSFCIYYLFKIKRYIGYTIAVFLAAGFLFNSAILFYQLSALHPLQFISGKDSKEEYLSKIFYLYPAINFINTSLPQDSRILFIAEARTFYCERKFLVNTPLDKNIIVETANRSKSAEDILHALGEMGITHILYNAAEVKRISQSYKSFNWASPDAEKNYADFMDGYLKIIFSQEGVIVARVLYQS